MICFQNEMEEILGNFVLQEVWCLERWWAAPAPSNCNWHSRCSALLKIRFIVLFQFFFSYLKGFFFFFLLVFAKESEGCKKMTGTWGMKFLIYYLLVKEIIYRGEIDRDICIYLQSCHRFTFCLCTALFLCVLQCRLQTEERPCPSVLRLDYCG